MGKLLLVIDMQNDFIDGSLGTAEAVAIVEPVKEKIASWEGPVMATQDTHMTDYLMTQEGRKLPVEHCIQGSEGWKIRADVQAELDRKGAQCLEKITFGAMNLASWLEEQLENGMADIEEVQLIGLCTDICVISNAMVLKAFYPELPVVVDASCCAGVTPESHERALEAMKVCQIAVINE